MTPYTLPEPRHWITPGGIAIGYHSDHLHAAFTAGAASRDAEIEALRADAQSNFKRMEAIANAIGMERDAALKRVSGLQNLVERSINLLENCSTSSGVCCCGDSMDRHSEFLGDHGAVDSGDYYANNWLTDARAAIAAEGKT